ncbi:hypothetical protein CRG98_005039 [Punica granatum]|uniref:Uncharacterized protein n=1 Tax=Punica granatum TaxID=22663 RepID=A0A2I0L1Y2_PUNGR|nr:hypothetical protein CRG98_005039 [Punica granatum]
MCTLLVQSHQIQQPGGGAPRAPHGQKTELCVVRQHKTQRGLPSRTDGFLLRHYYNGGKDDDDDIILIVLRRKKNTGGNEWKGILKGDFDIAQEVVGIELTQILVELI